MGSGDLKCFLCMDSTENKTTGSLATKASIVAHQNCLLYASGLYCTNSPPYDDLFGFDVEDVNLEIKRGKRLKCSHCKKVGATAGCGVKSCKHSYHYPCAVTAQAKTVENSRAGLYELYCPKHDPISKSAVNGASAHNSGCGSNDSDASEMENRHVGSEDKHRTPSKSRKRKYPLDSSDDDPYMVDTIYAPLESDLEDNIPPVQHRQSTADSENKSIDEEPKPSTSGVTSSFGDGGDETFSDSDHDSESLLTSEYRQENVPVTVITDSGPSETSPGPVSPYSPGPATFTACISPQHLSEPEQAATPHNITIPLEPPLPGPPSAKKTSIAKKQSENSYPVDKPVYLILQKLSTDMSNNRETPLHDLSPAWNLIAPTQATESLREVDVSDSDAVLFWRRCNEGGYTEDIFTELKHHLSSLAERVQDQHATQQDYTISLRILKASGRLPKILKQLEQDLDEQERKLSRKREALKDARAVLGDVLSNVVQ